MPSTFGPSPVVGRASSRAVPSFVLRHSKFDIRKFRRFRLPSLPFASFFASFARTFRSLLILCHEMSRNVTKCHFFGRHPLPKTLLYHPSKNESGKEKVKFFNPYQALTKVEPWGGKENGSDKVFGRGVVEFLNLSHLCQFGSIAFASLRLCVRPYRFLLFAFRFSPLSVVRSPVVSTSVLRCPVSSLQILLIRSGLVRFGPVWSGRRAAAIGREYRFPVKSGQIW